MTQRVKILGAEVTIQDNGFRMVENLSSLGPCQLQASPFCAHEAVMVRLDPMAMAPEDPAPASEIPTCQECFDHRSDEFLRSVAR